MKPWNDLNSGLVIKAVNSARFPEHSHQIIKILVDALKLIGDNIKSPCHSYGGKRLNRNRFGKIFPRGQRDESLLRNFIIAKLFQVWVIGFGMVPVVNNKGYSASSFVIFVEHIFSILGIGKVEAHLEEYQSFRKNQIKNNVKLQNV